MPSMPPLWQHIGKEDKERLAQGKAPDWSAAKRRQKDLDATHTKKHGKSRFGDKVGLSVDIKHGLIRDKATGTASEHDGHQFEELQDEHNTGRDVYADKATPQSADKRRSRCSVGAAACNAGRARKRRNRKIASKRAKVEHVFAGIRHLGGKFIRPIGQAPGGLNEETERQNRVKTCLDQPAFASEMPLDRVPMKRRILRGLYILM